MDTKKKERVGNYRNGGSDYRPKSDPSRVKVRDFVDKDEMATLNVEGDEFHPEWNYTMKPAPFPAWARARYPPETEAEFTKIWGGGDTSSSDGQFFGAGGHGEVRADYNAKYGSEPGVKFYTHISDRYAPFHVKVIAANASEAWHVLDGPMHHESSLEIREHFTDTPGAIEPVFGPCHLLGFRFAPRIRDLADRRLYVADKGATYAALTPMIGGTVDFRIIGENWDETLRLAASIKAGTVAPSTLMQRLAAYPQQNGQN